jgi:hypothetical protein
MESNGVSAALRDRLGREATLGLLELIETKQMAWSDRVLSITLERFERRLAEEIGGLRVAVVREIHEGRSELLKWVFAFWVGQFFAFAGLLAFMFRFTGR